MDLMSIDHLSVKRRLFDACLEIHEGEVLGLIGPKPHQPVWAGSGTT
jgi:hypothetical protein